MTNHEHRPGWLIRTYVTPRGSRRQIGDRRCPVMLCKVCGKRIVQQSRPTRLLAAGILFSLALMVICSWFAFKLRQPLLYLPFPVSLTVVLHAVYRRTTFVLLKYHQRRKSSSGK